MTISAVTLTTKAGQITTSAPSLADGVSFASMLTKAQGEDDGGDRIDFTRISPNAMRDAADGLVAAGRGTVPSLSAAVDLADASDAPDTPINMIAYLRHEAAANEKTPGGMELAFRQKAALAMLVSVQREGGGAVVYDREFPTAPRELTAEEISLKLKQAIEAFRKEAELTPTQRLSKKLRADVMKGMRVSEESLKAMPPAERDAMEKKIGEEVARKMALLGFAAASGKEAGYGDLWEGTVPGDDSVVKAR